MAGLVPWGRGRSGRGDWMTRRSHPLAQLQEEFDALWDRFLAGWPMASEGEFGSQRFWDLDLEEGDNEVIIRAEIPGFQPNELDVQLNNNVLTIRAEKKQEGKEGEKGGSPRERRYMRYERVITLPAGTDPGKAQANYQHGVLELHIPRSEAARGRRITVQGQSQGALPEEKAMQKSKTTSRQEAAGASSTPSGTKQGGRQ